MPHMIATKNGKRYQVRRPRPHIPLNFYLTEAESDAVDEIVQRNGGDILYAEGVWLSNRATLARMAVRALLKSLGIDLPGVDAEDVIIRELPPLPR